MKTIVTYSNPDKGISNQLAHELKCHPVLADILVSRGIQSYDEAIFFLSPGLERLTDPFLLKDMDKAVERVFTAVKNKEKILVFGDFDADGVTATAMLTEFLDYCDANVSWYIPHRFKEGYSFAPDHAQMAMDQDIDLIITVDCGITSNQAIYNAMNEDIDVIITDHHETDQEQLPPALAILNPKRKDCEAGLEYLAGVGVAFFFIMALRKHFRKNNFWDDISEPNLISFLDLFAIGTIGDMVPLKNENRSLAIAGIKRIGQNLRPGLVSLARIGKVDPARLDSDDISFRIVPRINAAGRVSHARICVSLLLDNEPASTEKTAHMLDQLNSKRQQIEKEIFQDIEKRFYHNPELLDSKLLFLWDDLWDPSVLGIVASKLSKTHTIPTILLSSAGELATGSCRSINNINIYKALKTQESMLVKFGGHAMASGLTVKKDNLDELGRNLNDHIASISSDSDFQKQINIDAVLDFDDITYDLAAQLAQLRPFGTDNPEPVFLCKDIKVISSFTIGTNHRKMFLSKASSSSGNVVEAFQFNVGDSDDHPFHYPEIIFKLKINKFKAFTAQIILEGC